MTQFDSKAFRQHFPALSAGETYLDSAATALKPQPVLTATEDVYRLAQGNVHRSSYRQAQSLTGRYELAREHMARWLGAPRAEDIVWTRGTTESLNLVAQSYARPRLRPGDDIVVAESEHHANLVPWLMVAQQTGARVVKWPIGADLLPDKRQLSALLSERTRIVALSQMSNVTGGCPGLPDIIAQVRRTPAVVVVDGAQGAVHGRPDVAALDIDFYAFSGHKLYGPTGIGVLYGKTELLAAMPPWQGGGKMLSTVSFDEVIPAPPPHRFEAGTPNIAGVVGLDAALGWLAQQDMTAAEAWSVSLADDAHQRLSRLAGFRAFRCPGSPLLSFAFDGIHHQDIAQVLAQSGVAVRAGQHCAQPLMAALGVPGTVRASFAPYNACADVDRLVEATAAALALFSE
ncbi:cysteine desulfurase CsdA [Sodalis endosymbiont of Spalangia cameroni]|uniref:cysteine desulfurase CsdA n=1 Tax=Sodalis praecaptivus TaxID=1239307 RepID=UPI0031F97C72